MKIQFLGIELMVRRSRRTSVDASSPQLSSSATTAMLPFLHRADQASVLRAFHAGIQECDMSNQIHNPIPEYADIGWTQPHRSQILVTDETATMSRDVFDMLKEYSHSTPSGQSNGKMWKLRHEDYRNMEVTWYLRWYEIKQGYVYCYSRKIVIANWKQLLGN